MKMLFFNLGDKMWQGVILSEKKKPCSPGTNFKVAKMKMVLFPT